MENSAIKEFLKRIELFKGLTETQLDTISEKIEVEKHKTGTMIFNQNNIRQDLYIIVEGEVELYILTPLWQLKTSLYFW